jgi:hypothetical protein
MHEPDSEPDVENSRTMQPPADYPIVNEPIIPPEPFFEPPLPKAGHPCHEPTFVAPGPNRICHDPSFWKPTGAPSSASPAEADAPTQGVDAGRKNKHEPHDKNGTEFGDQGIAPISTGLVSEDVSTPKSLDSWVYGILKEAVAFEPMPGSDATAASSAPTTTKPADEHHDPDRVDYMASDPDCWLS